MSRATSIASVAAGSLAIALLGWAGYLVANRQLEARMEEETRRQNEATNRLRTEARALREDIAARTAARAEGAAAAAPAAGGRESLAQLRALAALVGRVNSGTVNGRAVLPVLLVDGPAGGEIAELLGLSAAEVASLETGITQTLAEVAALALANTTVERRDRQVVIAIDAFAYSGRMKAVADAMQDRFMNVLGRDRFDLMKSLGYLAAATKELENFGYGASRIEVGITRQPDPAPGEPPRTTSTRFQLQRRVTHLNGRTSASGMQGDLRAIRDSLGMVGLLLPADL